MELLKLLLDQAAGVAIAVLLIMRIENKLDGLTNAVVKLSEVIRPEKKKKKIIHDRFLYLCIKDF